MSARRRRPRRETSRPSAFWPAAALVVPLVSLFAKIEFRHRERLPAQGSFILAPNHYSEFDPLIVAVGTFRLGREPHFMAKESLFRIPVVGLLMKSLNMIPVARAASAEAAGQTMATAEGLVQRGHGVIVYAEGSLTRDPDLWPMRGKTGVARLAAAGDIPVIPVATWGAQKIMPRYGKFRFWPLRKKVVMAFGEPISLSDFTSRAGGQGYGRATTAVMNAVAELLGEIRGEAPPEQRWDPTQHGQKETGRGES